MAEVVMATLTALGCATQVGIWGYTAYSAVKHWDASMGRPI